MCCVSRSVSLVVSPSRSQHFSSDSLSLSCEDQSNSTGWTVRRYTDRNTEDCSNQTGSTCRIVSLSTSDTGVYWCQSESGEKHHPLNITVHDGDVILDCGKSEAVKDTSMLPSKFDQKKVPPETGSEAEFGFGRALMPSCLGMLPPKDLAPSAASGLRDLHPEPLRSPPRDGTRRCDRRRLHCPVHTRDPEGRRERRRDRPARGVNDTRLRQTEVLKRDFSSLIETVRSTSPTTRIIVSGPLPTYRRGHERFSRLLALNEWLLTWCKEQKLLFVNNWNLFWERPRLFRADGLHPSRVGAELLSDNISRTLRSI
ncbi:Carboxy-S-adenosyl-L-methionine synthase [Labeo rohita]|uniref:Carboxy-S-adenosyl-L-methionine synthase n=1 Tax=Labeo rohita TaxID=84645 RepID=A0ABQ8L6L1_LABRO|nr:Carboxy-S-adenosyl-L-methionine synthase [Labeo rohita]